MIVVGSANCSNSVRLVEVALEYGAKAAYRVDYASEVKQEWLDGVETVGVTSGASVPEVLVQEVLADLSDAGYRDVEEVKTAQEDLLFSLPKELRQDAHRATSTTGLSAERSRRMSEPAERPEAAIWRVCDSRGAACAHQAARSDVAARDRTGSRRPARSRAGRSPRRLCPGRAGPAAVPTPAVASPTVSRRSRCWSTVSSTS